VRAFRELLSLFKIAVERKFHIGASGKRHTLLVFLEWVVLAYFDVKAFGVFTAARACGVRFADSVGQVIADKLAEEGEPGVEAREDRSRRLVGIKPVGDD